MSTTCPRCYNTSCPEPAEITLTQVTMDDPNTTHSVTTYAAGVPIVLADTPYSGFPIQVYVNGVLQRLTTDYTLTDATVTFVVEPATGDSITIIYIPVS